jgi:cytochrome c biogenesis protein CcmG/thiol:disulfide interchange protein DsbE
MEPPSLPDPADRPARSRWRPLFRLLQAASLAVVAGLLALFAWRMIADARGGNLLADVREGGRPAAPAFSLPVIWERVETWPQALRPALDDGRVSLEELRGYPVVVNFWASWCEPCKDEAPVLAASATAHAGNVVFLGLDIQDFTSDARRFLERYDVNYVSVRDTGNDTYDDYGLTGVPETFYIDRDGRVVAHSLGGLSRRELEAGIATIAGGDR